MISLFIIGIYTYGYFFYDNFINEVSKGLLVFYLILACIGMVLIVGRLKDINMSGWFSLLALIPFLNFVFFILYFIDGTVGNNKYGRDPKGRVKYYNLPKEHIFEQNHSEGIKDIERKINLIKESFDDGILDKNEYDDKKNELLVDKKNIEKIQANERDYKLKKEKLITLFENNIISQTEYDSKIKYLKKIYNIKESGFDFNNLDTNFYYFSRGKEYGPTTAKFIIDLLKNNKIKPETYIRFENEKLYNRMAYELINDSV